MRLKFLKTTSFLGLLTFMLASPASAQQLQTLAVGTVKERVISFMGSATVAIPSIADLGGSWFTQDGNDLTASGAFSCSITIANNGSIAQTIGNVLFNGLQYGNFDNKLRSFAPEKAILLTQSGTPQVCGSDFNSGAPGCRNIPVGGVLVLMARLYPPMTGLGHTVIAPCMGSFTASNSSTTSSGVTSTNNNEIGTLVASGSISYAADTSGTIVGGTGVVGESFAQCFIWGGSCDPTQEPAYARSISHLQAPFRGYNTGTTSFEINSARPF